jgi:hypothetical protein
LKNCFIIHHSFGIVHIYEGRSKSLTKSIVFFFVFLTMTSLGLALVPQVSSQPENVKVVSYSWYIDSIGYFIVVGEVQNVGPNTIKSVILSGTVYTMGGEAQASSYTTVYVNYLIPQQKAPFYMEFSPQSSKTGDLSWLSLGVNRVDFTATRANTTSSYQYPDLTVVSSSGGVDGEGVYWVSGTVKNSGTQTASNIRVIGTFYNASGTVVAVGYTDSLTPTSLTPSNTASFKVGAFDVNQTEVPSIQKISSYQLLIQTEEPILSGTSPTPTPSSPPSSPPTTTPPSGSTPSPTESSGSENPNVLAPEATYAIVVVIVILGLAGTLLMLRKRKSQAKSRTIKNHKSRMRKKPK